MSSPFIPPAVHRADLVLRSKQRNAALFYTKRQFTELTRQQVDEFRERVRTMREAFDLEGPGVSRAQLRWLARLEVTTSCGAGRADIDLDEGVEVMARQRVEFDLFQKRREELSLSEKLFNLQTTAFPDLYHVEEEMRALGALYDLYSRFRDRVKRLSAVLWADFEASGLPLLIARR
jgi:hypothetical protein